MKKITQKKLNQILQQHQLWLDSNCVKGERANLQGAKLNDADLRYANLRGANLQSANLCAANLQHANFRGADLRKAYFWDADLRHIDLRDANLRDTDFESTDLRFAQFGANIRDCLSFKFALITSDVLPWLILHPEWSEWKRTVRIDERSL